MKNPINTLFLSIFGMLLLFTACQQSDAILPNTNTNSTASNILANTEKSTSTNVDEQAYDHTLETLASAMLPLSHDPFYRESVFDMALKGFDDEHNVIMQVFADSLRRFDRNFVQEATAQADSSLDRLALKKAVAGMQYYDEIVFSQIYIPFIKASFRGQMPTIVIDYGNNDAVVPGKKYATDGSEVDVLVNEEYAKNNLVWVMSMNESINSHEDLKRARRAMKEPSLTDSSNTKGWKQGITTAYIEKIYIEDKKEGWLSGKAEVCYIGIRFGAPNNHETNCEIGISLQSIPLKKIGNSDLKKWKPTFGVWALKGTYPIIREDEGYFVLIWEKDNRRKNGKSVGHLPSQCSHRFSYISNETPYGYSSIMPYQRFFSFNPIPYTNPIWQGAMQTTTQSKTGWDYWTLGYGKNLFNIKYTNQ